MPYLLELLSGEQDVYLVGHILKAFGEFGETSTVPILLEWVKSADDFHRSEALKALAKIGDERAVKPAQAMLQEQRAPVRRDARGFMSQTHIRTISELVRQSLLESPNETLRQIASQIYSPEKVFRRAFSSSMWGTVARASRKFASNSWKGQG